MIRHTCLLLFTILFLPSIYVSGQQIPNYHFQQLSGTIYRQLDDSLNKHWKCPATFKDKKTQKEYEILWNKRKVHFLNAISDNDFIQDSIVYPYLENIVNELIDGNKTLITYKVRLFLDRTQVPNAYAIGEHIVAVNAGLVVQAHYREELALYIAHELSHDLLHHADSSMKKHAVLLTSDEYKESLQNVLSSKYERYSRLQRIIEDHSFDRSRHSRYNEQSADSLAILLLKNSKIAFDASYFMNLDTVDNQYKRELRYPIKEHFKAQGLDVNENWLSKKQKGLSSTAFSFKDTTHINDSLKTHPDCKDRYEHNKYLNSIPNKQTPIPNIVLKKAFEISLTNMYMNRNLCHALYRLMQEQETDSTLKMYDNMFENIIYSLLYSLQQMDRFNALRIEKKENVSKSYIEMQNLMEQIPEADLHKYCEQLNLATSSLLSDQIAFKHLLSILLQEPEVERVKKLNDAAISFRKNFPTSLFIEYTNQFITSK